MALVTMNSAELNRLRIIQDLISRRTSPKAVADLLGITRRQVRRLRTRYVREGAAGLASLRRGRPSNRTLPNEFRDQILALIRDHYPDFGPTLAAGKLRERHGIGLGVETIRRWMRTEGIWIDRKNRKKQVFQPRYRRECPGELVQIDGSEHWWFEDRGPQCTLLVYIDDATSRLMYLKFVESESAFSYFAATREYLERHGNSLLLPPAFPRSMLAPCSQWKMNCALRSASAFARSSSKPPRRSGLFKTLPMTAGNQMSPSYPIRTCQRSLATSGFSTATSSRNARSGRYRAAAGGSSARSRFHGINLIPCL